MAEASLRIAGYASSLDGEGEAPGGHVGGHQLIDANDIVLAIFVIWDVKKKRHRMSQSEVKSLLVGWCMIGGNNRAVVAKRAVISLGFMTQLQGGRAGRGPGGR